jgi:hypothetical protein
MASALIASYEAASTTGFAAIGEKRFTRRIFAHSAGEDIWHGIWIGLNSKRGRIIVQPSLVVFCPKVDKLVRAGISQIYGAKERYPSKRLGGPVMVWPLYDLVRKRRGEDRMPSSYDIYAENEIGGSVAMMIDDYFAVGWEYFRPTGTLETLEKRLRNDSTPSSGMYALAALYLLNGKINRSDVEGTIGRSPNEMTTKFAEWFGQVYVT